MSDFLAGMTRFLVRAMLVALGLVFFLSLFAAAMLLALVWCLGALWARLTGRPVAPWMVRVDPHAGWSAVYRSRARWAAASTAAPEEAQALDARMRVLPGVGEVTDVKPREPR